MGDAPEFRGTERYEVLERLGGGGMGTVYAVFDRVTGTKVALKHLHQQSPGALELFKREFRSLQGIQHRNLISLGELRREDQDDQGEWFFTMELVNGDDFQSFVRAGSHAKSEQNAQRSPTFLARGSVPSQLFNGMMRRVGANDMPRSKRRRFHEGRLRDALAQLACGLAVLHRAHKVHSDVKPSNIIVEPDGRVVLLDFGIAVDLDEQHSKRHEKVIGTVHYMAPEQVDPMATGPASDCYAVGVLLYEALTGTRPFTGLTARQVLEHKRSKKPPEPSHLAGGIPEDLERLCMDLLAHDPERRPTAEDILRRLGAWHLLAQLPPDSHEPASSKDIFVGRERELERLLAWSKPPMASRVVIVAGGSGIGKTALQRRFISMLSEDTLVLTGRCHERESMPFKGMDGAIDDLLAYLEERNPRELEDLIPEGVTHITPVFPGFGALFDSALDIANTASTPFEARRHAFTRLRNLFTRLARRTPVVITLDDMQFADVETWSLIDHLMRGPHPPSMLIVLFMRPEEDARESMIRRVPEAQQMALEPLSPTSARELAQRLLAGIGHDDRELAREIADESEGHPLFIREIVRYAGEHEGLDLHSDLLDEAMRSRFERLSTEALRLLQLQAVAGIPMRHGTMAAAVGLEFDRYLKLVFELRASHLVQMTGADPDDRMTHDHDRIRVTLLADLDFMSEQKLHLDLAHVLQESGEASRVPEIVAHHLMVGGRLREASHYWLDAAEQSMDLLAFESASARYQAALKTGDYRDEERQRILLRLAEASVNSGRGVEAGDVFLEVANTTDDRLTRMRCLYQAAEQLLISGHIDHGREILDEVLAIIDVRLPGSRLGIIWSLLWRRAWLRLRGYRWHERTAEDIPEDQLLRVDIKRTTGRALGMVEPVAAAALQCRALLAALRVGEPVRIGWCMAFEAAFLSSIHSAGIRRGRKLLDRADELAQKTDDKPLQAWILCCAGILDCMSGEYRAADARLSEAESFFEDIAGYAWEQGTLRVFRLLNLRFMGEFREMRALRDRYLPDAIDRGDLHAETTIRRLSTMMWLAFDDVAAARSDLESATWNTTSHDLQLQDWYEIRARAEIALYECDPEVDLEDTLHELMRVEKSNLIRVQVTRIEQRFLRGRVLLALEPPRLRDVARIAGKLEKEKCAAGDVAAAFLRAGMAMADDDDDGIARWLGRAESLARAAGAEWLRQIAISFQARDSIDTEGKQAIESSLSWMQAHGIRKPEAMRAFLLPTSAPERE